MFQSVYCLAAAIQNPTIGLGNRFIIIIISILIALFSRFILMRYMNKWMMSASKKMDASVDNKEPIEILHSTELEFEILNSESDFSASTTDREIMVKTAKLSMSRQLKLDLLIVLMYVISGVVVFFDGIADLLGVSGAYASPDDIEQTFSYFLYLAFFLVWTVMRYIGFRHQFNAYQEGLFRLISPLRKMVFAIFQSRWYMLWALVIMLVAFKNAFFALLVGYLEVGIPMLVAVVFHLLMIRRVRSIAKTRPNLKLLILRVFLINKTSLFTFSRLAKFWKHFGSYFTVADPSFYKVYWKRKFRKKFPVFIILLFLLYTQLENISVENQTPSPFGPFIFLLFVGAIIFIIYSIRRMKRNFVSHEKALEKDLANLQKHPMSLDKTFKEVPVSCYDNTWKMTVEKLVTHSDVVLMDLRGFSEKNKGCEFEVNLLLNSVSLNNVLFIGYSDAITLIKNVVAYNFETLTSDSPNKGISNPTATIFEVQKENNKETQQIMDVLIKKALTE